MSWKKFCDFFHLLAGQWRNIYIRKQTKLLTQFFSPIEPPLKCAEKQKPAAFLATGFCWWTIGGLNPGHPD